MICCQETSFFSHRSIAEASQKNGAIKCTTVSNSFLPPTEKMKRIFFGVVKQCRSNYVKNTYANLYEKHRRAYDERIAVQSRQAVSGSRRHQFCKEGTLLLNLLMSVLILAWYFALEPRPNSLELCRVDWCIHFRDILVKRVLSTIRLRGIDFRTSDVVLLGLPSTTVVNRI